MKSKFSGLLIISLCFLFACNSKINHDLRKIETETSNIEKISKESYLKLHFHNGDVAGMSKWKTTSKDSISGKGTLYNPNRKIIQKGKLLFSLNDVAIIETNDLAALKDNDNARLASLGILLAGNLILDFYCLANPKACFGSCPTFYAPGKDQLLESNAEGFSKSISPLFEEGDIDALKFSTKERVFQLTMKNEALETHVINEVKLYSIPRKVSEMIYHNPDGIFYKCQNTIPCKKAFSKKDFTDKILFQDDKEYFSKSDSSDLLKSEEIFLNFETSNKDNLGLVINFRQTLMSTFLFYNTLSMMGDEVASQFAKLETKKFHQKRFEKAFNPLRFIKVYQQIKNRWKLIGKISEQGPIAKNLQMIPLLPTSEKQTQLKLVMAQGNWRLDYLGLTEIISEVKPNIHTPIKIHGNTKTANNLKAISKDDKDYFITFSGEQYLLDFELPTLKNDDTHELFVYSKGYYLEWIRKEWLIEKDIKQLNRMMLMHKKTWRNLAHEFKEVEAEMENTFWNSKVSTEN